MLIKPNYDRVLAKKIVETQQTLSGIQFKQETQIEKAVVVDISHEIANSTQIKIGNTIFYESFNAIELGKDNLILIKQIDILGYEKQN